MPKTRPRLDQLAGDHQEIVDLFEEALADNGLSPTELRRRAAELREQADSGFAGYRAANLAIADRYEQEAAAREGS